MLRTRLGLLLAVSVIGLSLLGAGLAVSALTAKPEPQVCDGVDRLFGGCDPDQPVFVCTTCTEVGDEFGQQLNERVVRIIRDPAVVDGERRSVRNSSVEFLLTARANQHLRAIGIVAECGVDEFLAAAEMRFTEELRTQVGPALSEPQPLSYADWLADLRRTLRAIDMEENAP